MWKNIKTTIKAGDLVHWSTLELAATNSLGTNPIGLVLEQNDNFRWAVCFTVLWPNGNISMHPRDELVKVSKEEQNPNADSKLKG